MSFIEVKLRPARSEVVDMPALPTLFPPELTGLARKRLDAVFETQSKLVDTLPALSREWMSFAVAEQDFTADLLSKLTAARSISELTAVYQEWLNRRMEMFAEKGRSCWLTLKS
jgi:hypothetical protein